MIQSIFNHLYEILADLSAGCQSAIKPHQVILELTEKEPKYHFRVPNSSRKQIIAWGSLRLSQSGKFGKDEPCVIVSVDAILLDDTEAIYIKHYHPDAHYGRDVGEVQVAVCQVGGNDYKLALKALTEASLNLISGKRYKW